MIQEVYEPGSVFKGLTMAAAINAGELTPNTTFMDSGPIPVDFNSYTQEYDYYIETFNKQYHGLETMTQVLEHSCNTGMTFVVKKLGASLFYSYLKAYGLLEKTGLGIDDEVQGDVEHSDNWTESEMVTKAFGQGISMTPLQLVQAYTTLANGGTMMRPYLIKKIEYADGSVEDFEPEVVAQVLKAKTASEITAMLTSVVNQYTSKISLEDHYVAGKSEPPKPTKMAKPWVVPDLPSRPLLAMDPLKTPNSCARKNGSSPVPPNGPKRPPDKSSTSDGISLTIIVSP